MLSNARLWHRCDLWAEVASIACYLVNRSPYSSFDFKILEEIWSSNRVDYSNMRIFGCPAYAYVNDGKLAPRVVKCIFLGYASESKGYCLWFSYLKSRKLILSSDVTFNKDELLSSEKQTLSASNLQGTSEKVEFEFKSTAASVNISSSSINEFSVDDHGDDHDHDDSTISP